MLLIRALETTEQLNKCLRPWQGHIVVGSNCRRVACEDWFPQIWPVRLWGRVISHDAYGSFRDGIGGLSTRSCDGVFRFYMGFGLLAWLSRSSSGRRLLFQLSSANVSWQCLMTSWPHNDSLALVTFTNKVQTHTFTNTYIHSSLCIYAHTPYLYEYL